MYSITLEFDLGALEAIEIPAARISMISCRGVLFLKLEEVDFEDEDGKSNKFSRISYSISGRHRLKRFL